MKRESECKKHSGYKSGNTKFIYLFLGGGGGGVGPDTNHSVIQVSSRVSEMRNNPFDTAHG